MTPRLIDVVIAARTRAWAKAHRDALSVAWQCAWLQRVDPKDFPKYQDFVRPARRKARAQPEAETASALRMLTVAFGGTIKPAPAKPVDPTP